MEPREIHIDLLIGTRVRTLSGECAGRIEEILVERRDDDWRVVAYHLGPDALIERFMGNLRALGIVRTAMRGKHGYRVAWRQLDISDPEHPCLRCALDELEKF
jgi:hypothetical protein